MNVTMAMNVELNGPPDSLHQLLAPISNEIGNFNNHHNNNNLFSTNFTLDQEEGLVGDYLSDLYSFLRQSQWNTSVLPITAFLSVLMLVGVAGNGLVIAVFLHAASLSRVGDSGSGLLVLSLAVTDLLVCVLAMPGQIVRAWYVPWRYDGLCKAWELVRHAALPISAVILVAIAHDRYRLICCPTASLSPARSRRTFARTMLVAAAMGLGFGVPPMLAVGVNQRSGGKGGSYYLGLCEVNGLIMSQAAMKVYWYVLVSFFLLVLLLLLLTYSAILVSVWQHASSWKRRTSTKVAPRAPHPPPKNTSPTVGKGARKFAFWRWKEKTAFAASADVEHRLEVISEHEVCEPNSELNLRSDQAESESSKRVRKKKDSASKYCDSCSSKVGDRNHDIFTVSHSRTCTAKNEDSLEKSRSVAAKQVDEILLDAGQKYSPQENEAFSERTVLKMADSGIDSVSESCGSVPLPSKKNTTQHKNTQPGSQLIKQHSLPLPTDSIADHEYSYLSYYRQQVNPQQSTHTWPHSQPSMNNPCVETPSSYQQQSVSLTRKIFVKTNDSASLSRNRENPEESISSCYSHDYAGFQGTPTHPKQTVLSSSQSNAASVTDLRTDVHLSYLHQQQTNPPQPLHPLPTVCALQPNTATISGPAVCMSYHQQKQALPPQQHEPKLKDSRTQPTSVYNPKEESFPGRPQHNIHSQSSHPEPKDSKPQLIRAQHFDEETSLKCSWQSIPSQPPNPDSADSRMIPILVRSLNTDHTSSTSSHPVNPPHPSPPQPKPKASISQTSSGARSTKPKVSISNTSNDSRTMDIKDVGGNIQARKPQYRAHVKTAAIFFLVTLTFLASYMPTFLMIVGLVRVHSVLYYSYLFHAAANPLLYSIANKKFRASARQLFACKHLVHALGHNVPCFRCLLPKP